MSRPVAANSAVHRLLEAKRNRVRTDYLNNIHKQESTEPVQEEGVKINIPQFNIPKVPKFEPIKVPKIEPRQPDSVQQSQENTLDAFEREYQEFIEKLKKEKEKKELKEELKAYCRDYINELLGIKQEQPVEEEPEPEVKEPENTVEDEPLFADVDEETTPEEPRNFEQEYQDFINNLKQTKRGNNNE